MRIHTVLLGSSGLIVVHEAELAAGLLLLSQYSLVTLNSSISSMKTGLVYSDSIPNVLS